MAPYQIGCSIQRAPLDAVGVLAIEPEHYPRGRWQRGGVQLRGPEGVEGGVHVHDEVLVVRAGVGHPLDALAEQGRGERLAGVVDQVGVVRAGEGGVQVGDAPAGCGVHDARACDGEW